MYFRGETSIKNPTEFGHQMARGSRYKVWLLEFYVLLTFKVTEVVLKNNVQWRILLGVASTTAFCLLTPLFRHRHKIFKERPRIEVRKQSFFFGVIDPWNSLPNQVVHTPRVEAFKRSTDIHWRGHPQLHDSRTKAKLSLFYHNKLELEAQ